MNSSWIIEEDAKGERSQFFVLFWIKISMEEKTNSFQLDQRGGLVFLLVLYSGK